MEQIVVDKNLERYQQTGKIDIYYLNSLSYTGQDGLLRLYEMDKDYPELQQLVDVMDLQPPTSWQSYNFTREKVLKKLRDMDLTVKNN